MGAPAEFQAEVPDTHRPYDVSVFFGKQHAGAHPTGLLEADHFGFHGEVAANDPIHELHDLLLLIG